MAFLFNLFVGIRCRHPLSATVVGIPMIFLCLAGDRQNMWGGAGDLVPGPGKLKLACALQMLRGTCWARGFQ